ncbi:MAG: hypothetical protein KIH64_014775 [Mycobacterium sp.]|nr:hypothetical protein [Mycobacterium sp.]
MNQAYEPSPQSVAGRAVAYLRSLPADRGVTSEELGRAIGAPSTSLHGCLMPALNVGLVHKRSIDGARTALWLAGQKPTADLPVLAAPAKAPPVAEPEEVEIEATADRIEKLFREVPAEVDSIEDEGRAGDPREAEEAEGAEPEEAPAFCCALFDDGRLYLERGDEVFTLQAGETDKLLKYLGQFVGLVS